MPDRSRHLAHGITGAVFVAVVAVLWANLAMDPALTEGRGRDPGPAFLPLAALALLGASALGLAVVSFMHYARDRRAADAGAREALQSIAVPALMVATLLAFVAVIPVAGFLPAALVFTAGWSMFVTRRDGGHGRRVLLAGVGGALVAFGIFTVFSTWIGVPL